MKDFTLWFKVKPEIEKKLSCPLFSESEVWWCSLGLNIGFEQDGKNELFERPVLIFRKYNKDFFLGLPLTSKIKEGVYYHKIKLHGRESSVILSQSKAFSAKRLIRKIGKVTSEQFIKIEESYIKLIKTDPLRGPRVPNGNL